PYSLAPRHALGLPAGSVRSVLALSVLGLLWLLALQPMIGHGQAVGEIQLPTVFMDLQILMVLILAHFFTAHGHSIRSHAEQKSPLGLPRGSVRFLLLTGYLGLAGFLYRTQPKFEYPPTSAVILLLVLMSGFFLGHVLTGAVRWLAGGVLPYWFQDIQAWVALLAMLSMGVLLIILLFINPSLSLGQEIPAPVLEAILAALVGFYFGSR
ncbi:MAG: hypothetical protein ACRELG_05120, partial [Gemmataceae bacterium]